MAADDHDRILLAKEVVTLADGAPAAGDARAVTTRAGRIVSVGTREEVLAQASAATEVVDLGDACILPGLVEPHTHPDLCAEMYSWIDVSGFRRPRVEQVEAVLADAVKNAAPGEWLFAFGLDPMLTADLGTWGRERLDTIAPANPLLVMLQSMHTVFVNSLALSEAGIGDDTPDPPGGGRYQHDADGRLTGRVFEAAAALPFLRFAAARTADAGIEPLRSQYDSYARAGLTTIGTAGLFSPLSTIDAFRELAADPNVPIRNVTYLRHHHLDDRTWTPGEGDDYFRIQGVKLWYDGSPYSGTMLLDEPYLDSRLCCCTLGIPSGTHGHANFEPEELRELATTLHRQGWQVLTHAQGDRGTREILDLYEHALESHPRDDHRWRLEHCALISAKDLARAARLGVAPSFHVNHIHYYGPELRDSILGSARADALMPIGTALRAGHRPSLHADSPMYPPEPFRLMKTAVTRATRTGETIAPQEAITAEQALRAITLDAAWQLFAEDRIGSIEPGKLADFTVVDRNPLKVDPHELDEISVLGTWLGGRRVEPGNTQSNS
jgi:predicted amidohydrolase YtcJ